MADIFSPNQTKARLNSLRLFSGDCVDESLKLFSNFGESLRLKRNNRDDFSFNRDGLFVIKNLSEQEATIEIEVIACTGDYLVMRSSHQSARTFVQGQKVTRLIKAGESITLRSNDAQGKGAANI